jgi:hypothetical protein
LDFLCTREYLFYFLLAVLLVVNLRNAGYPRTWGQGFKAIAHVAPDLVPLPPAAELPRLMTEFAVTRPVILFGKFHFIPMNSGMFFFPSLSFFQHFICWFS